jgi:hypothetical protein
LTLPQLLTPDGSGESTTGAAVLPPIEAAQGEPQLADVAVSGGRATVLRNESSTLDNLAANTSATLSQRDELMTLNGTAEVELFPNQRMIVQPASRLLFDILSQEDNAKTTVVNVQYGDVEFQLDGPLAQADIFEVVTGQARIQSRDGVFVVRPTLNEETYVEALSGTVLVGALDQVVELNAGQSTFVDSATQELVVMSAGEEPPTPADVAAQIDADDPTPTPVPTYTPVEESEPEEPAAVALVEDPTATPTEAPTAEPTATPTPVPTETATPVPTETATSEPTATAAPTQRPPATATPTPTETPTPDPRSVRLIVPNPGVGGTDRVLFDWEADHVLAPGEAYELIFWKPGQDPLVQGFGLAMPTRATEVQVDLPDLDNRLGALLDPGDYLWGVRIVTTDPEYSIVEFTDDSRAFRYTGPSGSADGGGPPITGE